MKGLTRRGKVNNLALDAVASIDISCSCLLDCSCWLSTSEIEKAATLVTSRGLGDIELAWHILLNARSSVCPYTPMPSTFTVWYVKDPTAYSSGGGTTAFNGPNQPEIITH